MRSQKQIEGDIAKISQVLEKARIEQDQIKVQEESATREWEEQLLDLGASEIPKTLKAISDRKAELEAVSIAATRKLKELEFELDEYHRSERVKGFSIFQRGFWAGLEDIKKSLDVLAGKVTDLGEAVHEADRMQIGHGLQMDFDIALNSYLGCESNLLAELKKDQNALTDLLSRRPK